MQPSVRTVNYTIHCNMKSIKTLAQTQYTTENFLSPSESMLPQFPFLLHLLPPLSPTTFHFFLLIFPSLSCHFCSQWPWHVLFPVFTGVLLFHSCQVTSGLLAASRTSYLTLSLGFLSCRISNIVYLLQRGNLMESSSFETQLCRHIATFTKQTKTTIQMSKPWEHMTTHIHTNAYSVLNNGDVNFKESTSIKNLADANNQKNYKCPTLKCYKNKTPITTMIWNATSKFRHHR